MIEARLIIEIPGLESLAAAITQRNTSEMTAQQPETQPSAPVTSTSAAPASVVHTQPVAAPTAQMVSWSMPPMVPTSAPPSFTAADISRAGAAMLEASPNKMPELMALLQQFGVPAITQLAPDQLGSFAIALRGLGANI